MADEVKKGDKGNKTLESTLVTIDILCDTCGINPLDRAALKKKFGREEKSIEDWKTLLKNDIDAFNN